MYLSTSLTRLRERMQRRQTLQMKKRSTWFLSPQSLGSASLLGGSHEVSMGKSSLEATSSDALASDVTASDCGMSDTHVSDAAHISSDLDCTFDDQESLHLRHPPASAPIQRSSRVCQDMINANHGTALSTPSKSPRRLGSELDKSMASMATDSPSSTVTESQVRYFMVENFYGASQNGES